MRGPDGGVGSDEEDVAVAAAEGEVDGAGQGDLADQVAARVEDLNPAERRRVNAAGGVDLQPVGEARRDNGEEAACAEVASVDQVPRHDVVRARGVVAAGGLV